MTSDSLTDMHYRDAQGTVPLRDGDFPGGFAPVPHDASTHGRTGYRALWAAVPGGLAFLLPLLPIVVIGLSIVSSVFSTGIGLAVLGIGIPIVVGALWLSRFFAETERIRLRTTSLPPIAAPAWDRHDPRVAAVDRGFLGRLLQPLANGRWWLALVHTLVVNPVVGTVTWSITITWLSTALAGVTYWLWAWSLPDSDGNHSLPDLIWEWANPGSFEAGTAPVISPVFVAVVYAVIGLVFLATLPFVVRGLVLIHHGIARGMIGAWASEGLRAELDVAEAARTAALAAEDTSIRRLERDIHDGPQQRLIRLQMDIAAAERRLDSDPEATRTLLAEASTHAKDALDELRALSKGLAPPLLQDRGLVPALESLSARSVVPTTTHLTDLTGRVLPPEVERSAYFIAAELLTNVAKHAQATSAFLTATVSDQRSDGARAAGSLLVITVTDNGRGGAAPVLGHGLAGLDDRVRGLNGTLTLDSPIGGPTTVAVTIPLPAGTSRSAAVPPAARTVPPAEPVS
ncbi:sensor histidine kinase [Plantibacter sp. Mn2098]|uniref:sensor histidine kinase n=1 Tax=Plantibacter sp. Mn2098 TaxID=3395266 RepID=UPI003BBDB008